MPALRFVPPRMRLVRLYGRRWWGLRAASPRPALVLILGFAALIVAGTLALLLPISVHRGGHADLLTALFTATSAVCVTGLTVVDTGPYWAPFGQAVILVLMEVGGLGFVIGATALVLLLRRRLSIRQRVILQDIGATSALGVGRLAVRTVLFTLGCEAAGALLLWLRFGPRFGAGYGLWLAVFHAVSAFTNGSFDLFGGHGKSLADYRADPLVLLTMAGLIISGGLSFLTLHEVVRTRRWRRLSLDSKVILLGTGLLLLGGTALLLLTEADNPASLGRLPFAERVLNALRWQCSIRKARSTPCHAMHAGAAD